jgi:hypothetical protein
VGDDGRAQHWAGTYDSKGVEEVSWFQRDPAVSLRLLSEAGLGPGRSLVDVGGGASVLVDRVLDLGVTDVTVLDIADAALAASRSRLGRRAAGVTWLARDVLNWEPERRHDLWHDRAVFHFLTEAADRDRYREVLDRGLADGGSLVLGTFAEDGPRFCSGLPVDTYDAASLAGQFPGFEVRQAIRDEHHTPWGAVQPFTWVQLSRAG